MLSCLQNMMQLNDEAKNAMDATQQKYIAAVNDLNDAELKKTHSQRGNSRRA